MSADDKDKLQARKLAILLIVLLAILAAAFFLVLPAIADFAQTALEPGVGIKQAAVISFFITLITLVIFAFAAGDGLLGEVQFMLAGFFGFFLSIWFLIAWIF